MHCRYGMSNTAACLKCRNLVEQPANHSTAHVPRGLSHYNPAQPHSTAPNSHTRLSVTSACMSYECTPTRWQADMPPNHMMVLQRFAVHWTEWFRKRSRQHTVARVQLYASAALIQAQTSYSYFLPVAPSADISWASHRQPACMFQQIPALFEGSNSCSLLLLLLLLQLLSSTAAVICCCCCCRLIFRP